MPNQAKCLLPLIQSPKCVQQYFNITYMPVTQRINDIRIHTPEVLKLYTYSFYRHNIVIEAKSYPDNPPVARSVLQFSQKHEKCRRTIGSR